jgi:hypothetical protein
MTNTASASEAKLEKARKALKRIDEGRWQNRDTFHEGNAFETAQRSVRC